MKHALPLIAVFSLLFVSGCVDRKTADQKLVKACSAAIEAFSNEGDKVEDINSQTIGNHPTLGATHRQVKLNVAITDGYHTRDEEHSCVFFEEFGFANMSHRASIYQLNYNGQIIGQENYEIQGSLEDMTKLTDAVDKALR